MITAAAAKLVVVHHAQSADAPTFRCPRPVLQFKGSTLCDILPEADHVITPHTLELLLQPGDDVSILLRLLAAVL
jgi:hypothetical protein